MTSEIFRAAVDDYVSTESQRTLQIRSEECIVYYYELVMLFGDSRDCFNIGNRKKRIRGCLDVDCLNIIIDGILNSFKIRCVYDLICDVEVLENVIKDPECSPVDIV